HITRNLAYFPIGAVAGGSRDDLRAVDGRAAAGVGDGEPAGGRAGGAAGAHGTAVGAGLQRAADRGDPRLRRGCGAHLAAPLRGGGRGRAGGRAAQRAAAEGPAGAPDRGRPGAAVARVPGLCPALRARGTLAAFLALRFRLALSP